MSRMSRRASMATIGAALATPALLSPARAAAVTLRLHHFLPAAAPMHTRFFEVWAAELAAASDGAIEVQIFPAMQLGGKPPQLADQARQGICDIAWTLPVYTPDRFLIAETLTNPFMVTNAERTSIAFHQLMTEFGPDEFRGLMPLAFHTHDGGKLHTRRAPVRGQADLEGLKLRAPNQATGQLLRALGAEVVFFPVTEMVVGLSNGVIDGCCLPYEVVPAFRLQELTAYHAAPAPGGRGLYTNTFAFVMNQARYEGLPDDLRAVIDAASGAELSARLGRTFDQFEAFGKSVVEEAGNEIVDIPTTELTRWREAAVPVHEAWVNKLTLAGYDGAAVMARAHALLDAEPS